MCCVGRGATTPCVLWSPWKIMKHSKSRNKSPVGEELCFNSNTCFPSCWSLVQWADWPQLHAWNKSSVSLCFLNLKLHHRFDPFVTLDKYALFGCIHLLGNSMGKLGLISLVQSVLTITAAVSSSLLWCWVAGDECNASITSLQEYHYLCYWQQYCFSALLEQENYLSPKRAEVFPIQGSQTSLFFRDCSILFPFFEISLQL